MFTIWEVLLSNVLVAVVVSAGWIGYVRPLRKRLTRHSGVREDGEDCTMTDLNAVAMELAANFYMTRAHWTDNLVDIPAGGRRGTALCTSEFNPAVVYDQQALDDSKFRAKERLITALLVCGKCVSRKAKREAADERSRTPVTDRQRWGAKRLEGKAVEEKIRLNVRIEGGCWRWTGAHAPNGYGQLTIRGKRVSVHRLAYEFAKGAIPEGLEIDHTCRVRDCTNPAHLEAVTHAENVRRAAKNRNQQRRAAATTTMEAA